MVGISAQHWRSTLGDLHARPRRAATQSHCFGEDSRVAIQALTYAAVDECSRRPRSAPSSAATRRPARPPRPESSQTGLPPDASSAVLHQPVRFSRRTRQAAASVCLWRASAARARAALVCGRDDAHHRAVPSGLTPVVHVEHDEVQAVAPLGAKSKVTH